MFFEIFQSLSSTMGAGGLFDFGATLPLLAIQFLILMFVLNTILYNPLLTVMNERNEYIVSNLTKSAKLIAETTEIKTTYENEILEARKAAQLEITQCQKSYKELFDIELNKVQERYDSILAEYDSTLANEKASALTKLETEIESISEQILGKIYV
ncbi:ATP synthase subunit b (chloroplast) [Aureococcus anophagefferens]|jgi:F-type H+-transporting ATPase subunit b|uniref:ATP synthase CF0 B'chain subunit II n=2 Tax=Aureococcus anophagefferens TaxID=44056 RepID=C6KIJ3_AURAN|nr:ATP synthase CF0 B'chain subunit II [Aureococcus anophagefferens]ACS36799.1 ATP synthase CF0 B'chain subunit II [Aureococcus anophagefferens]KAH8042970.1 ATP synthase subunit b' [Aureococcus anophagefferens]KAH8043069.1 ATP synthase subunit b' [Aureococcus anophagefferens]KAH8043272.1 ATP synthase subunit b' [Aureococcus anophagefferens]|tara:strand:- start:147 stop:614 length:468 start_codon:yes stop_codon:yes gene_type:complete